MSSASTLFVLCREESNASPLRQHEFALKEEEFDFPQGSIDSVTAAEAKLQRDSAANRDSRIWVCAQSVTDCFFYLHVMQGETVRALILAETQDAQWERVDGAIEPWEEEAFEDEVVFGPDDEEIPLVRENRWPARGDIAIAPDAMKYADAALSYWRERAGTSE